MQIHNWIIAALVGVNNGICVQAYNQIIAQFAGLLQEIQVSNMEEIKGAGDINLQIE